MKRAWVPHAFLIVALVFASALAGAQQGTSRLTNDSGAAVNQYEVVVLDSGTNSSFTTTTSERAANVVGVVAATSISNGAKGLIWMPPGIITIEVVGTVTRGDYLITSTTAGSATSGGTSDSTNSFGLALETGTNTNISMVFMVFGVGGTGAITPDTINLPDISGSVGKLIFGTGDDLYMGYDGTLNFLGMFEGTNNKPAFIFNNTTGGAGTEEPFTFAFGVDWDTWEANTPGGASVYPDDLHNVHFWSPSTSTFYVEFESLGLTGLIIDSNSNEDGTGDGYIAWQNGDTSNPWTLGLNVADNHWQLDDTFGLGANPVIDIAPSTYLLTYAGDMLVNGGDIGVTADADLIGLASGALSVRGTLGITDDITMTHTGQGDITIDAANSALITTDAGTSSFSTGLVASIGGTAQFRLGTVGTTSNTWKLRDAVTGTSVYEVTRATPNVMTVVADFAVNTAIAANGASITSDDTTFALLNATPTTVNAFGAATAINMGASTGTLTVGNTTLAAKAITASTTLGVTGNITGAANLNLEGNVAGEETIRVVNTNTGTASTATVAVGNSTGARIGALFAFGTGYTTSGGNVQDAVALDAAPTASGGLSIMSRDTAGDIRFYAGGGADADMAFELRDDLDADFKGAFIQTPVTITTDTTPTAVGMSVVIIGTWTAANDITDFDNDTTGQELEIWGGDTDCNIVDGSGIELDGGVTWNAAPGACLIIRNIAGTWYEKRRSTT